MNETEVLARMVEIVSRILSDKGAPGTTIDASTVLLAETGIDSLDLAMLVRELEEVVGHDPFAEGFIDFQTAGELARLYVRP